MKTGKIENNKMLEDKHDKIASIDVTLKIFSLKISMIVLLNYLLIIEGISEASRLLTTNDKSR